MKKLILLLTTAAFVSFGSANCFSKDAEIAGALIGAGSGALIGHAIGGDTESVIMGTAIGGALGFAAGHAHRSRGYHGGGRIHFYSPFFFAPHPYHHGYSKHYRRYHHKKHHIRHKHRCKVVKKHVYRHGYPHIITKRICKDYWGSGRQYREHHNGHRDLWY